MCSTESRKPSQRFLPSLLAPTATPAPPLLLSRCTCPCSCPGSGDGGGCGTSLRSRRCLLDAWASLTSHCRLLLQLLLLPCCSVPPCASRSWPRQTGRRPPRLRRQRGPRSATQGVSRRTTRNSSKGGGSKRKKNAFARRHSPKRRKKGRSHARPITSSHEALCFLSFSALSAGETAAYSSSPPHLGRSAREINGKSKKRERLEITFFFFFFRCCPPLCSTLSVSPLTPSLPSSSLRETDVRLRQRR